METSARWLSAVRGAGLGLWLCGLASACGTGIDPGQRNQGLAQDGGADAEALKGDAGRPLPPLDAGLAVEDRGSPPPLEDVRAIAPADVAAGAPDAGSDVATAIAIDRPPPRDAQVGPTPNPIPSENLLPGSGDWDLAQPVSEAREIEGYSLSTSVVAGDTLRVAVSVHPDPHSFSYRVYRLGYYGGLGGRLVTSGGPLSAIPEIDPLPDVDTGRLEAAWPVRLSLPVDPSWITGPYVVVLTRDDGYQSYVPFIVRDESRRGALLFVHSVTTWQAYNDWGGLSLYTNTTDGARFGLPKASAVSFNRPFRRESGVGELFSWEIGFARWLEQHGYDVSYSTSIDIDRESPESRALGYLSIGHDEYWSKAMRDHVEGARDRGMHLAFFSGNTAYWHIRLEPASDGTPRRTQTCYKEDTSARDPVAQSDPSDGTDQWRVSVRGAPARPEEAMMGVMFDAWQIISFPMVVAAQQHWALEGSGLTQGDVLPNLVGYESDRSWDDATTPAGLTVLMRSPVISHYGLVTRSDSTIYQAPSGAWVFAGGSIDWSFGLNGAAQDARLGVITANVLRRFGAGDPTPPLDPPATPPPPPTLPAGIQVGTLAGSGIEGFAEGPGDEARFFAPVGLARLPDGSLAVADVADRRIRHIAVDGTVSTLAGSGRGGGTDGPGVEATFDAPAGIAALPDGTLFVVDPLDQTVRRILPDLNRTVDTVVNPGGLQGFVDGPGAQAQLATPVDITYAPDGALYVADLDNGAIRRIEARPPYTVTTVLGTFPGGYQDGPASEALFFNPTAVRVAADGAIYVLDTGNCAIRRAVPSAGTPGGYEVSTLYGGQVSSCDGSGLQDLAAQHGLELDAARGQLLIADTAAYRIVSLPTTGGTPTLIAGDGSYRLSSPTDNSFAIPSALMLAPDGTLLVADTGHHMIRWITRPPP